MLKKRGQLTLFILVAIVIVIAIVIYFYFQGAFMGEERYDPKVEVLRQTVLDCFDNNYGNSLAYVGSQGGYFDVPEPRETIPAYFFSFEVPYYYFVGELHTPTIDVVEDEIEKLVDSILLSCFDELNDGSYESVEFGDHSTTVEIKENEVIFTTDVDMVVGYDEKSAIVEFKRTSQSVDSDIFAMHDIAVFIAEYLKNNNEWLPYSDIVQMSREYDLYVNVIDSDDGMGSSVEILSAKADFYPSLYSFKNKYGAVDYEEFAPLL
jgi:hypothetical protein